MNIEINPKSIFIKLLYVILFLLSANIIGIISKFYFDIDSDNWLIKLFDFNAEMNIPSLYSSFVLLLVSIILLIIASTHKRLEAPYSFWLVLMVIFLFLSIDEGASIHEICTRPLRKTLNTSGLLYFA